jgi:hypothetical protein
MPIFLSKEEFMFLFSPRQGQQMGMLSHQAFHDPQILHMLQHGGSVQEKALQVISSDLHGKKSIAQKIRNPR